MIRSKRNAEQRQEFRLLDEAGQDHPAEPIPLPKERLYLAFYLSNKGWKDGLTLKEVGTLRAEELLEFIDEQIEWEREHGKVGGHIGSIAQGAAHALESIKVKIFELTVQPRAEHKG